MMPEINVHTHKSSASFEKTDEIRLYNLPFPENRNEATSPCSFPENTFFSAGLHPLIPEMTFEEEDQIFFQLEEYLIRKKLLALGECGLDKNSPLSREGQMNRFRRQILLSEKYSLPLILHNVRMWEEAFFLRKECHAKMPWIAHSFRGSPQLAKELEKKGIFISFAPVFLEKSSHIDEYSFLSRIFLETDESDISLSSMYKILAEKWQMELEDLREKAARSFKEVFYAGK